MNQNEIELLHAHRRWANSRVLNAAGALDEAAYAAAGESGAPSLHATLVHMYAALRIWRLRCQEGLSPARVVSESDLTTLPLLRSRWAEDESQLGKFLQALTTERLAAAVPYRTTGGVEHQQPLWTILTHLALHDMQHRAEAAQMLTRAGQSPGNLDLIIFQREQGDGP